MEKPIPTTITRLDYNQCIKYIEDKYSIKTRGYSPKAGFTSEMLAKETKGGLRGYLDFWHWILDHYEVHNGCEINLNTDYLLLSTTDEYYCPYWVKEILVLIKDEFGNPDFWVWW